MQKRTRKHVRYILVERDDRVLIFHDHGVPLETFILPKALYTIGIPSCDIFTIDASTFSSGQVYCLARNSDDRPLHHYSHLRRLGPGLRLVLQIAATLTMPQLDTRPPQAEWLEITGTKLAEHFKMFEQKGCVQHWGTC